MLFVSGVAKDLLLTYRMTNPFVCTYSKNDIIVVDNKELYWKC